MPSTFGPAYLAPLDSRRVTRQMDMIRLLMRDEKWRTLGEIEEELGYPQASISAQLRHLKKERFGAYRVTKQRRTEGTWEYRVLPPLPVGQGEMW